jgi:hypothetical protein
MPNKQPKPVPSDPAQTRGRSAGVSFAETRWQDRPRLSMQLASEISALSVASLYKAADDKRLVLVTQYGRTLVDTSSLIEFMSSAAPWKSSGRGKEARAKRAANQARRA